jgi:trimeric autotransporter adhesin
MPTPGPLPVISSVSASTTSMPSTPYCSPSGLTLTVNGTNFVNGAVVNWNGSAHATTFVSSTQLTASVLATDIAFPGTAGVSVSSASGTSNTMPFTLTTPATSLPPPSVTSISQSLFQMVPPVGTANSVPAGSPSFTLTVNGSSFVPCSVVNFGGTPKATSYVGPTQLNATISAADVFTAGSVNVTVFTLMPGGGTSAPIVFTITP